MTTATQPDQPLPEEWMWIEAGLIHPGMMTLSEVMDYASDVARESALTAAEARHGIQVLWDRRLAEEESWSDLGDGDRLQLAFEALEGQGVAARMGYGCCAGCVYRDLSQATVNGAPAVGYVYFDQESVAEVMALGRVRLITASFRMPGDAPLEALIVEERRFQRLVSDELDRVGLRHTVSEDPTEPILVETSPWRKRLPR